VGSRESLVAAALAGAASLLPVRVAVRVDLLACALAMVGFAALFALEGTTPVFRAPLVGGDSARRRDRARLEAAGYFLAGALLVAVVCVVYDLATAGGFGASAACVAAVACGLGTMAVVVAIRDPHSVTFAARVVRAAAYSPSSKDGAVVAFVGRVAPLGTTRVGGVKVAALAESSLEFEEGSTPATERWRHDRKAFELVGPHGVLHLDPPPAVWGSSERVWANEGRPSRTQPLVVQTTEVLAEGARAVAVGVLRRKAALTLSSNVQAGWEAVVWATSPGRDPVAELRVFLRRRTTLLALLAALAVVAGVLAVLHPWPRDVRPPTTQTDED
jgi:hypothetical protein